MNFSAADGRNYRSWNGTFQFLRPQWQTFAEFLDRCAEFDGSEHDPNEKVRVQRIYSIFASPGPSFDAATTALNDYAHVAEETREQPPNRRATFSCLPWIHADAPVLTHGPPWIAIVTLSTADYVNNSAVALSLTDKKKYCDHHGYDLHIIRKTSTNRAAAWSKLPGILSLLDQYDWVVSLDADTVIYDHSIRLEEFLDPHHDLIVGLDGNGVNSGVFFLRNSTWSKVLLTEAWTITNEKMSYIWWEQAAIMRLLKSEGIRNHVKYSPQMHFNSYVTSQGHVKMDENGGRGPFIVHFAGLGPAKWDMFLDVYAQRRNVENQDMTKE